ncbi:hypothetical protein EWM64_g5556 [Hericium alpestre]|uniref:Uncharacterized protein n=1 Tax=Hericium alpestre TaxID=135208 RepID=A0A4Y9ZYF9_9AGAM|nr:hypothetical protein EWM64_g5556 [Hericium alpestre]
MPDETISTGVPPTIHKDVLTIPGTTPASKTLIEHLLEQDLSASSLSSMAWAEVTLSLLAAYDLGAPADLLRAVFEEDRQDLANVFTSDLPKKVVERQDVEIHATNWTQYLGQAKYYANFALFFAGEVKRLGSQEAFEHYAFSAAANDHSVFMAERFFGGAAHPLIQMGYAFEFNSDAMVVQALAQTAVHEAFQPDAFVWGGPVPSTPGNVGLHTNGSNAALSPNTPRRLHARGQTLFSIIREMYDSKALTPVLPYDADALLSKRRKDAMIPERTSELRRLVSLWSCTPDLSPSELAARVEELFFVAAVVFAGVSKRGRKPRLDFFLMHVLTSSIFVLVLSSSIKSKEARAKLLNGYLTVVLSYLLLRGRPRIDPELLMSYTATPVPPSQRVKKGDSMPTPGAVGNSADAAYNNPWPTLVAHALPAHDAHTVKSIRALYIVAQRYGTVPAGSVIGAFDADGKETHVGTALLDGSVFVRAAGVLLDQLGWVGEGQPEGKWDRSALGWDAAWDNKDWRMV